MKIIQFMPKFGLAGAETMCENLTYELVKKGHEVIVISLYDYHSPITNRLENTGVRLVYLDKKPGLDLPIVSKIRKILKEYRPHILHTHLYLLKYVYPAAISLPIKGIVHTLHNVAEKENNKLDRTINKFLFKAGKAIPVALTEQISNTIQNEYGISQERIPVILNGVNLRLCIPETDYSLKDKEHIDLIHVGRYTPVKNHEQLIDAVVKVHEVFPNIRLHLYGDGELKGTINDTIKNSNACDYIFDHGLTDNVYIPLSKADIFLLPSIYEGMPMTIIEAMATGLPVVASAVGGVPDMIEDGENGLLCGTDANSISDSIMRLINDEDLCKSLGGSAIKRAKDFSSEKMANDYIDLYNEIISNGND